MLTEVRKVDEVLIGSKDEEENGTSVEIDSTVDE